MFDRCTVRETYCAGMLLSGFRLEGVCCGGKLKGTLCNTDTTLCMLMVTTVECSKASKFGMPGISMCYALDWPKYV